MSIIDEIVAIELARMKRDTPFDSEDYWLGVKHGLQCGVVLSYGMALDDILATQQLKKVAHGVGKSTIARIHQGTHWL